MSAPLIIDNSVHSIEHKMSLGRPLLVRCSFETYKNVRAINHSLMKKLVVNPKWVGVDEDNPAFQIGRQFHEYVLEPEEFARNFVIVDGDARTKEYKEKAKQWPTHKIIKGKDMDLIKKMYDGIRDNKRASYILDSCNLFEVSLFWIDPIYNIECKGRADALCLQDGSVTLVDLKTTKVAIDFIKNTRSYGYDSQVAFYKRGLETLGFDVSSILFIVSEKEKLNDCIVYETTESYLKRGEEKLDRLFAECIQMAETGRNSYPETLFMD